MKTRASDIKLFDRRRGGAAELDDAVISRIDDRKGLVRRFWGVVVGGYIAAILVVCAGVWLSAQPSLKAMQRDAMMDRAIATARIIDDQLQTALIRYQVVAQSPAILRFVLGLDMSAARSIDQLATFEGDDYLRHALMDYRGQPIILSPGFDLREARAGFSRVETFAARNWSERITADGTPTVQPSIQIRNGSQNGAFHVLFSLPIVLFGQPEGALVVERVMPLTAATAADIALTDTATWEIVTRFQRAHFKERYTLDQTPVAAPIGNTGLYLVRTDQVSQVATQGWEILSRVLQVVVWGLLLPFLGMAVFGRGVIAKPFEALSASRQKLAQSKKEAAELAQIATLSNDSVLVTDAQQRIIWLNPAFTGLTGFTAKQALGKRPGPLLQGPDTDPDVRSRIRAALAAGKPCREEILNYRADGAAYWISLSISPLRDEDGKIDRFVAISADITEKKEAEAALVAAREDTEYQASHDALTGLPNRRALDELLETEIGPDPRPRTLVRIDLDHFKAVNDTHGHAAGDHVLVHVSTLLRDHIGPNDFAGRVGGDEFVIALGPERSCDDGMALTERLLKAIRKDIPFDGKTCRVGASFGVAGAASGLVCNADLLVAADAALYEAKEMGRNQTVLYAPEIHAGVQDKRRLALEIERGIEREEFVPLFQPQIDTVSQRIVGAEVLLRWQHPDRGLLRPSAFLATAARLSMLPEIDRIIYRQGLRAAAELERVGCSLPKVSFNVGSAQIEDPELIAISELCTLHETRVGFEILESVLIEEQSSNFRFQIDRLRERGYRIEIDDFGSGHASVVGLMQLNPDAMKIDQRLIIPITESARTRDLVKHIVGIGQSFGISVTAEGVESEEHVRILTDLGCNTLQGYHYAKPLTVLDLLDFIEEHGTQPIDPIPAGATPGRKAG